MIERLRVYDVYGYVYGKGKTIRNNVSIRMININEIYLR